MVVNGVGTPTTTTASTTYDCLFGNSRGSRGDVSTYESGKYVVSQPIVFLPADAVVQEGDYITSETPGYSHTFEVTNIDTIYNFFDSTIDHIEASLRAVEKRS